MLQLKIQFTTRRFMIVVAVATTLVVSGAKARRFLELREGYLGAADYHAEREQEERQELSNIDLGPEEWTRQQPSSRSWRTRRRPGYHADMKRKWERAASPALGIRRS